MSVSYRSNYRKEQDSLNIHFLCIFRWLWDNSNQLLLLMNKRNNEPNYSKPLRKENLTHRIVNGWPFQPLRNTNAHKSNLSVYK